MVKNRLWFFGSFFLAGFLIYSNTLHSGFHFDDFHFILDYPSIKNLKTILFEETLLRRLTYLTFGINYHFWGFNPFSYHCVNLAIHILTSFIFYIFLKFIIEASTPTKMRNQFIALLSGFIFLVHPVQTQSVNYIYQRTTLLAGFFYILTLVFYCRFRLRKSKISYGLALVSAFLGSFTKEIFVTLPAQIILLEMIFFNTHGENFKRRISYGLPFIAAICIIPWITLFNIFKPSSLSVDLSLIYPTPPGFEISWVIYALTQLNVFRTYLRLLIFPFNQNVDYDYPAAHGFSDASVWVSAVVLLGILVLGFYWVKKKPLLSYGIFWFFLVLSVEFVAIRDFIFEHRLYLPTAGLGIFFSGIAVYFFNKKQFKLFLILLVPVTVFFGILTYKRNFVWRDEITLWNDVIEKSPYKARVYGNRGLAYLMAGDLDMALADLDRVLELDPADIKAYVNRGAIYGKKGNFEKAQADFNNALKLDPRNPEVFSNRGTLYQKNGQLDEALNDYNMAIFLDKRIPEFYFNRGLIYDKKKNSDMAISDYSIAIGIDPSLKQAYYLRSLQYYLKKDFGKSWQDLKKSEELGFPVHPGFRDALLKNIES